VVSCAKATYYQPVGFNNLLDEIKIQSEYFYKGEVFSYTPTMLYIQIYLKKDISDEKVKEIKELVISYVQSVLFKNFLVNLVTDNFTITLYIETPKRSYCYSSHKEYDFKDWN